jgi:calcium channel MID1
MYISQSEEFTRLGPGIDSPDVVDREFDGGYIRFDLDVEGDLFIGVGAPNNTRYSGIYNYELAVSIDSPFHLIEPSTPFLFFVDSDSRAALLQTDDTTEAMPDDEEYKEWMAKDPLPYTMFAHRINDSDILGLHHSYCGLNKNARIKKESNNFESSMTNRGIDQKPKQQFYVKELNQSSSYYGFLAEEGRGQGVGGGGKVWRPMNFTTKEGIFSPCLLPVRHWLTLYI